jgi:hypothetical protein
MQYPCMLHCSLTSYIYLPTNSCPSLKRRQGTLPSSDQPFSPQPHLTPTPPPPESVLWSRSRKEPNRLAEAAAGAMIKF